MRFLFLQEENPVDKYFLAPNERILVRNDRIIAKHIVKKRFRNNFQLKKRLHRRKVAAKLRVSGKKLVSGPAAIRTRVNGYLRNYLTSKPIRISWLPYEPTVQE
jgi:hypothetical protein